MYNYEVLKLIRKPIAIFVGHYGSGKTEIAVNLAFQFKEVKKEVTIVDLDLIKPYFRCRLLREDFKARVIRLIAPEGGNFYADIPILMPEARGVIEDSICNGSKIILDVGGDDLGARVLGSISDILKSERSEVFFVINNKRPFAEEPELVVKKIKDIESVAFMKVTGLIANSHLMEETTLEDVISGVNCAIEVSKQTSIPVSFCAIIKRLKEEVIKNGKVNLPVLFIERHILPPFETPPKGFIRPPTVV